MGKKVRSDYFFSPLAGSTPWNLFRLWGQHLFQPVSFQYLLKAPIILLIALLFTPFNWYEWLRHGRKIRATEVKTPIFIIGHWRSGTTHLHNLFVQDEQFGCTSMVHTMFPRSFMTNPLVKVFLKNLMPSTRPMDNMKIAMESPQEDELALANLSPYSFLNAWMFPQKHLWKDYRRYVRLEGLTDRQRARWKRTFMGIIRKAVYSQGGRQLILKNPAHTGRVEILREMFPDARFIFLHRHPVTVFFSTRRLYDTAQPAFGLQTMTPEATDTGILRIYEDLVQSYLDQRAEIPSDQLTEVRYDDLVDRPLEIMEQIYRDLNIPGWESARPQIEAYLRGIRNYKKNVHQFSEDDIKTVQERWAFAFEAFDYAPRPV